MRYNYLSKGMKKKLQELPMKIDIAESEEADEDDGEMSVSYTHLDVYKRQT